jgi:hypothetical protein
MFYSSKQLNCIPVRSKSKFKSTLIFDRQVSCDRGIKAGCCGEKASNEEDPSQGRGQDDLSVNLILMLCRRIVR